MTTARRPSGAVVWPLRGTAWTGDAAPWWSSPATRLVPSVLVVAVLAGLTVRLSPLAPFAVIAVVFLVVAVWNRPLVASLVVASVAPALSGLGRGTLVPAFKISELLLVTCAATVFFRRRGTWRAISGVDVAFIVFAVVSAGLALYHGATGAGFAIDVLLRSGLLPTFLFLTWWTASRGIDNRSDVLVVLRWVLLISVVPALVGVAQYFDVGGVRQAIITLVGEGLMPLPGEEMSRITGPFTISHSFGGYLIVPIVLATVLLLRGDKAVVPRPVLIAILMTDLVALVLGVTVTLVVWVPFAILVAATLSKRLIHAAVFLGVVVGLALLLFSAPLQDRFQDQTTASSGTSSRVLPQTLEYRILVWQRDYIPLLGKAAPVGLGIDEPDSVIFVSTENQYLTLILRGGVGLVLVAVVAFGAVGARSYRLARNSGGPEQSSAMAIVGIVMFLPVALMVWPYLTNAGLPQSLLGFAGAVLVAPGARRSGSTGPGIGGKLEVRR